MSPASHRLSRQESMRSGAQEELQTQPTATARASRGSARHSGKDNKMTPSTSSHRLLTRTTFSAIALATVLAISGCSVPGLPGATGAPSVQKAALVQRAAPTASGSPAASTAPAAKSSTETPAPKAPAWVPVSGDLSRGSVTHTLGAASRHLIINYWMSDNPAALTPDDAPIIRLSAHLDGSTNGGAIEVTRFNATALGKVLANDTGNFAAEPPYSYSSGVVLPANPIAHSTQIIFTFDLLTETAPGTGVFTRQTILDTVTVGYALPGTASRN
ncbi:hypothetical protein [Arthrobacter sp.]|uniref:hypothetical protein n=1 Tax=Arthrobacter sp. TaxID=1667 RepID=UPI0026DFA59A|nr:hypothetical protein [Arthrobacter sp.]MDO5753423.1 hypothetical protein [Arthrobacter sp.]